jgi:hypothetical protein
MLHVLFLELLQLREFRFACLQRLLAIRFTELVAGGQLGANSKKDLMGNGMDRDSQNRNLRKGYDSRKARNQESDQNMN